MQRLYNIIGLTFKQSTLKLEPKANVFNFARTLKENYTFVVYTNLSTSVYKNKTFHNQIKKQSRISFQLQKLKI